MARPRIPIGSMRTRHAQFAYGVAAAILGVVSVLLFFQANNQDQDRLQSGGRSAPADFGADLVLPPASLEQMLAESELVVLGAFSGRVNNSSVVYPANASPEGAGDDVPRAGGFPFTELDFKASEYLKGSGGESLAIRWPGDLVGSDGVSYFPPVEPEKVVVLFLARDPNASGTWGPQRAMWGTLTFDDGTLRYQDANRSPVPFLEGMTLADLKSEVRRKSAP